MHIHAPMLHRKFELIPIKLDFKKIFKVAQESGQRPCTIVHVFGQISSKMIRRILHFNNFSDAYTCSYAV